MQTLAKRLLSRSIKKSPPKESTYPAQELLVASMGFPQINFDNIDYDNIGVAAVRKF